MNTAASVPDTKRLNNGMYLISSYDAYMKHLKEKHPSLEEKFYPTDYPKAFPCLVKLYNRYQWRDGLSCEWETLDQYRAKLQRQLSEVDGL